MKKEEVRFIIIFRILSRYSLLLVSNTQRRFVVINILTCPPVRENRIDFIFSILTFRNQFCPRPFTFNYETLRLSMIKYLSSLSNFETSRLEYFVTHENANFSLEVFFRDPLRIIHSSSLKESALSFSIVWNKKCETLRKLSANCSNLPPSVEKWKSVFPRAEVSSKKEECRGYEERGGGEINALRRGID